MSRTHYAYAHAPDKVVCGTATPKLFTQVVCGVDCLRCERLLTVPYGFDYRPVNAWGAGDLPCPYAPGDLIDVPAGAKALERMDGWAPGRYRVIGSFSVDEGDASYVRLGRLGNERVVSGKLYVVSKARSGWDEDCDHLEGCKLVETADLDGWATRESMLLAGWRMDSPEPVDVTSVCLCCHGTGKRPA